MTLSTPTTEDLPGNGSAAGDEDAGGVQAVDTAVRVLSALIDSGAPLMLKTVAERAEMQPPKAHRYLVSFCRGGLAERDAASGGYRLGPLAVRLGLAALRRLNVVQVASPTLGELRDELGFTAGLAVWGAAGPTFVRFEETNDALIISGRPGSVMPMLTSSTGRVFGAYLPASVTAALIQREMAGFQHPGATPSQAALKMTQADVDALFERVRRHKLARIEGDLNPGLHGVSAPIFDHTGAIAGVITVMGSAGLIDTRLDGRIATTLMARAEEVSRRMGWA
ncbi:putative HTH-type transcriptional regulator RhmR [Variovorax sp. PBS-H4]|uniref:IclR family transcriptional regulator n=1 Tax=Variovorax sp. PBS-H4 TaxID=434008 RepID=UPI001318C61E|nr:IclR family transcriptional regulator [Variovorax sp. PBS-H4]VTU40471.1 putative HTH-type transcriptional regulator RhmR [Variovorax sp. PBS-H4]